MPRLDPTRALNSPWLAQRFLIIRRPTEVNPTGDVNIGPPIRILAVGIVTPGESSLSREAEFQVQSKSLHIATKTRLYGVAKDGEGQQYQPDIILWHGSAFIVSSLDDWTSFGAGYTSANCISTNYVDPGPAQQKPYV